jgi:hypothetical protein
VALKICGGEIPPERRNGSRDGLCHIGLVKIHHSVIAEIIEKITEFRLLP